MLGASPVTLECMGSSESIDGWDLTVPADEAELMAQLRRHGVRPGQRVHMRVVDEPGESGLSHFRGALAGFPEPTWQDFEHASRTVRDDLDVT